MLRGSGVGGRRRTRLDAFKNVLLSCLGLGARLDDSDVYELDTDFDFGENLLIGYLLSCYQIFKATRTLVMGGLLFLLCLFPYLKHVYFSLFLQNWTAV